MSMIKGFPIDYVRQTLEQTLFEEKKKNPSKYFGGSNEVRLFSFYEQLKTGEEVDRYAQDFRDLTEQQNRSDLMMNGVVATDENPSVTNLSKGFVIPMSFACTFRVGLANRDKAIDTINNLISVLKGRKQDVAGFGNGIPFKVGTIANSYEDDDLYIHNGDFLGEWHESASVDTTIKAKLTELENKGIYAPNLNWCYVRGASTERMFVAKKEGDSWELVEDGTDDDIIFPPSDEAFERYKISMSFDSIRVDEPRNLNSKEYVVISFGGSATICNHTTALGNDLVKVGVKKSLIKGNGDITLDDSWHWLEPLELPSSSNLDSQMNQVLSNKFVSKSHNDGVTLNLQYTFLLDKSDSLMRQWFDYARYGIIADGNDIGWSNGISPNMVYGIREVWSVWGEVDIKDFYAKITDAIDIENTESDTLTIKVPMQPQGV